MAGRGLKTGMYYLRTKAAADAIKFTVDVDQVKRASETLSMNAPLVKAATLPAALERGSIEALKADEPKYACVGCSS